MVDESLPNIDEEIDRAHLIDVIREALVNLTPREEIVLRLRFGISETDLKDVTTQ